jgi:hypothetical protein
MKVFIDIVANHTSWDSVLAREEHPGWYTHDGGRKDHSAESGLFDVADLDYGNKDLRKS